MNEPPAKQSDAKTVWQQDGDYYKPSVSIHGEEGIGISTGGTVIVKTATQWQDLERQLTNLREEAGLNASMLAHQTNLAREAEANAASWQEQCETARDALVRNGRESDAALGALAKVLRLCKLVLISCSQASQIIEDAIATPNKAFGGVVLMEEVDQALASDFVQRAVEASKAKDAEIERLKELAKDHAELHLKHLETEAKLAVAMELLARTTYTNLPAGDFLLIAEIDAFLADPSQAAAQYRAALAVVERVKAEIGLVESASRYLAGEPAPIRFFAKKLKALLGDAAQEEQ